MQNYNNQNKTGVMREIPPEWDRLMEICEKMKYGRIEIIVKDGIPTDAEHVVPHIKLNGPKEDFKEKMRTLGI